MGFCCQVLYFSFVACKCLFWLIYKTTLYHLCMQFHLWNLKGEQYIIYWYRNWNLKRPFGLDLKIAVFHSFCVFYYLSDSSFYICLQLYFRSSGQLQAVAWPKLSPQLLSFWVMREIASDRIVSFYFFCLLASRKKQLIYKNVVSILWRRVKTSVDLVKTKKFE